MAAISAPRARSPTASSRLGLIDYPASAGDRRHGVRGGDRGRRRGCRIGRGGHEIWTAHGRSARRRPRARGGARRRRRASSSPGARRPRSRSARTMPSSCSSWSTTLEEDDDVQTVWGNYEMSDEVMEKLAERCRHMLIIGLDPGPRLHRLGRDRRRGQPLQPRRQRPGPHRSRRQALPARLVRLEAALGEVIDAHRPGRGGGRGGVPQRESAIDPEARPGARRRAARRGAARPRGRRICAAAGQEGGGRHRRRREGPGPCHGPAAAARREDRRRRRGRRARRGDHPRPSSRQPRARSGNAA